MTEVTEAMCRVREQMDDADRYGSVSASIDIASLRIVLEVARIPAAHDDVIEQAARIAELHICGGRGDYDQGGADVARAIAREIRAALFAIPIPAPTGEKA